MNLKEIYELIGPVGAVLIVVGLVGSYLALWNTFYLNKVWKLFKKEFASMKMTKGKELYKYKADNNNPMICIIRDIVFTHAFHSDDIRAEVAYLFHKNFKPITNSLGWIKLIAAISPLLGLLGTVLGMVTVFKTIASSSSPDPTMLAGGIWEALITTVLGLIVAIPMLMAYYYLLLKMKGFRIEAVEHSYQAIEWIKQLDSKKEELQNNLNDHVQPCTKD